MKYPELLHIRMRPEMKVALQVEAEKEDTTLSHIVRMAIKAWLKGKI